MALTRRALGGITIGGSAAVALSACGGGDGGGSGKTEIVWAVSSGWVSWNMNTTDGNTSYTNQALTPMNPLGQIGYDFDPDGEVFYDDAIFSGPPELVSEEPLQVKLNLNENAQWSDGEPVRVEDFIFHWYSMSGNPEHANQEKALPASVDWGSNVESIEQAEDGSILVTYVEGYIDPEWAFAGGIYLPSHIAEAEGFADWQSDPDVMGDAAEWFAANLNPVATGPYVPVDSKLGEYVIYEPNENYQGSVKPTIEKLTMQVVEGTEAIITELRQGAVDGSWPSEFSEEELAKAEEDEALVTEVYDGSIWQHIDINMTNPFLQDKALREAIFTAIDVKDIIDKNYPETEIDAKTNHFFTPESEYFVDHIGDTTQGSGDLDAARALLEEAGYTGFNSGETLTTPDGEEVAFNIRYGDADPVRKTASELTQSYLAEIGISLELSAIPDSDLGDVLAEGDYDMIVFGWSGNPAFTVAPGQYYRSDSGSNFGKFENDEVDELVGQVRSTTDLDESAGYANQILEIVVPEAYVLPLFDEPQSILYNSNVLENVHANGNSQSGPIYNVREWKIK